ncbi:LysE family translocator [Inhella gelatinilytica]|uniref:LysE family translocator n=1 Tax=Inhella gelatinilytica TaxID=2795030 RepID=A0A931IRY3_9BURK|nr:LysE family translocator [Inhella gelatinilytica]MBH9551575.1 LysE family translocator [Inhella gelatinilytica]
MLSPDQALAFLLAALVVTASPGPDNLMVLGLGMSRGRWAGLVFGLGCALGCLNHTLLAVLGVSALVAASPAAFLALKVAGGLYLVWMGVQALRSAGGASVGSQGVSSESLGRLFLKGLVANAINPKVVLFFLAFLPQFVQPARGPVGWQLAQLGVIFTLQAAALFGLLGWFAGAIGQRLQQKPGIAMWLDRAAGVVFVGLGVRLVLG